MMMIGVLMRLHKKYDNYSAIETSLEWQWFTLPCYNPHCGQDDDDDDDYNDDDDDGDDDGDDDDDDDDNDDCGYSAVVILTVVSG